MIETLKELQSMQAEYCGVIDFLIETRKDQGETLVSYCNYGHNYTNKSKLYIRKFKWNSGNKNELRDMRRDLEFLKHIR